MLKESGRRAKRDRKERERGVKEEQKESGREYWCGGAENRRDMCLRVHIGCCTWRYDFVSKRALRKFALPPVVCELYRVAEQTECGHMAICWLWCKSNFRNKRGLLLLFMLTCPDPLWALEAERHIEVPPRSRIFGLTRTLCAHTC